MSQTGYTPIQVYYSTVTTRVPVAANLALGELALNTTDGILYFKTTGGTVTQLANASVATGNLPGGSTGTVVYQSATGVTAYLPVGTSGYVLASNGSGPVYVSQGSLSVGTAAVATTATTATTASTVTFNTAYSAPTPSVTGTVLGWNGAGFSWVTAPAATTASSIAGGAQYQIPFQSAVSTTAFSANLTFNSSTNTFTATNITGTSVSGATVTGTTVTATKSTTSSTNVGAFSYGTLNFNDTGIVTSYQTSVNSYFQEVIQNTSNGNQAAAEFVAYNDQGTATTNFAAFGINSSGYTGSGAINAPGYAYVLSGSTDLVIGTIGANAIHLVANSNSADSITINANNAVAFNGNYGSTGQVLQSNGTTSAPSWIPSSSLGTSRSLVYFMAQF